MTGPAESAPSVEPAPPVESAVTECTEEDADVLVFKRWLHAYSRERELLEANSAQVDATDAMERETAARRLCDNLTTDLQKLNALQEELISPSLVDDAITECERLVTEYADKAHACRREADAIKLKTASNRAERSHAITSARDATDAAWDHLSDVVKTLNDALQEIREEAANSLDYNALMHLITDDAR